MTDNEIIQSLSDLVKSTERIKHGGTKKVIVGAELLKDILNFINRKDEQIESLISGQETLQKYIAEKDAEIKQYKARILNDTEYIEKIEVENRKQQAEIERLKEDNFIKSQKRANIFEILNAHEKGKTEAVTEFSESVINDILPEFTKGHEEMALRISFAISRKAKEMVGES